MPEPRRNIRRVLVTGFGRFPGTRCNPTEGLMRDLQAVRRPALSAIAISTHVLPVTWAASRLRLAHLQQATNPDAIVMFGLAGSATTMRVETRARNSANPIRRDASGSAAPAGMLRPDGPALLRARADLRHVASAIRRTGARVRLSNDAGTYLCNAVLWAALEATECKTPVVFIHVPWLAAPRPKRRAGRRRLTRAALLRAAVEAILATRLPPA
jgi:pyroglutamyl-peptidase